MKLKKRSFLVCFSSNLLRAVEAQIHPWNPLSFPRRLLHLSGVLKWVGGEVEVIYSGEFHVLRLSRSLAETSPQRWQHTKVGEEIRGRKKKFFSPRNHRRVEVLPFRLNRKCKSSEISSRISFLKVTLLSFLPSPFSVGKTYSTLLWTAIKMCSPLPMPHHVDDADRLSISPPTNFLHHLISTGGERMYPRI